MPQAIAPSRTGRGTAASAPGGRRTILAMTPASTAVATARAHMNNSDSSSIPRAATRPSMRQISLGRKADEHQQQIGLDFGHRDHLAPARMR